MKAYLSFLAIFSFVTNAENLCVSIQSDKLNSDERIAAIELNIQSARIVRITDLPVGWVFTIDNSANWSATFKGNIEVFSASKDNNWLKNIAVIEKQSGKWARPFDYQGTLLLMSNDENQRKIDIEDKDFLIAECKL